MSDAKPPTAEGKAAKPKKPVAEDAKGSPLGNRNHSDPVKPGLDRRKELKARAKKLEEELFKLDRDMDENKPRRRRRRRRRDGDSSGEESEDEYSGDDDRRRGRRSRRDRQSRDDSDPDERRRRGQDSDGRGRRGQSRDVDERRGTRKERGKDNKRAKQKKEKKEGKPKKESRAEEEKVNVKKQIAIEEKPEKMKLRTKEWIAGRLSAIERWKTNNDSMDEGVPEGGFGYEKLADAIRGMRSVPEWALIKLGELLDAEPKFAFFYTEETLSELQNIIGGVKKSEVPASSDNNKKVAGERKKTHEKEKPVKQAAAVPTTVKAASAPAKPLAAVGKISPTGKKQK